MEVKVRIMDYSIVVSYGTYIYDHDYQMYIIHILACCIPPTLSRSHSCSTCHNDITILAAAAVVDTSIYVHVEMI